MKSISASVLFAACAAASAAAHALPLTDQASIEIFAGGNTSMPGAFRGENMPLDVPGSDGTTVYRDLKYSDAYSDRYNVGAEFDYAFNSRFTTFGRASYSEFDGKSHDIGEFVPNNSADTIQKVGAQFGDTTSREFELGTRYTFAPGAKLRPFVGAALGVTRLSAARAEFDHVADSGKTAVDLSRAGDVFQQRLETGLTYSPMDNFDLRLTAAASHLDAGKRSEDPNLALIGLDTLHTEMRGHWDYPAELGAVWHF